MDYFRGKLFLGDCVFKGKTKTRHNWKDGQIRGVREVQLGTSGTRRGAPLMGRADQVVLLEATLT